MSIFTRVDITAVKLSDSYIFTGIGSYSNIYDYKTVTLLDRIHCLRGQKVYGFVLSDCSKKIIVFGGKQFTVLKQKEVAENKIGACYDKLFEAVECDDWLHSVIWLNNDNIAVLSAHNVVQQWNVTYQTITSTHRCSNNPILYSGLLLRLQHDILVLAGTVFSEVLIHCCGEDDAMHTLKGHRGVIFSISCKPEKNVIVTTSDDRSVRIWSISSNLKSHNNIQFWRNSTFMCIHEVYGHSARVMRSCITDKLIISAGEDSALCFWNYDGKLLKKVVGHQNGCIWAVDADVQNVVTGGGDCGITVQPISVAEYKGHEDIIKIKSPKKVFFTARHNIIVVSEDNVITYFNLQLNTKESIQLHHESSYKSVSISNCKQLIAIVDMCGNFDVFAERGKDDACLLRIVNTKINFGKILSINWAGNRDIVFCSEHGQITVMSANDSGLEICAEFELPLCKERWLTATAFDYINKLIIVGDRCGNIHVYKKGQKAPLQTLTKVHGRYGPTSITVKDNKIISTGRNGAIKYFSIDEKYRIQYMITRDVEVQWVEKFLHKLDYLVCGFQERDFVVLNIKNNSKLIEVSCGGGHRGWDAVRYIDKINDNFVEILKFIYIKSSDLHINNFELNEILPKNIINGSHAKEINCLNIYKDDINDAVTYFISGGEDTTLRISTLNKQFIFEDIYIFKQFSNIRALKTLLIDVNKILLVTGGGRAQICIKILEFIQTNTENQVKAFELINHLIKGSSKERKSNKKRSEAAVDFDPETRIMDVAIKRHNEQFFIFAGCSDAYLRIFKLTIKDTKTDFECVKVIKIHNTCILKTSVIKYENKEFLVTCTTRGEVTFYNISNEELIKEISTTPTFAFTTNKSGINSFSHRQTLNNIIIATGGDDNTLHLTLIEFSKDYTPVQIIQSWCTDKYHSSQITGLILLENYILTTSIDQRITLCKIKCSHKEIKVDFVKQEYSDVSDIQGIDLIEETNDYIKVCVFGKGMEILQLRKESNVI